MPSQFGGIPLNQESSQPVSKFGGVPVQRERTPTDEIDTRTGKPVTEYTPSPYDSPEFATYFKQMLVDDPQTKLEIYSKARFPDLSPEERQKRYRLQDGEVIFQGDDQVWRPETPGDFLSQVKKFAGSELLRPSNITTAVGALGGLPGAMAGGAVGEGVRKLSGSVFFDEPQTYKQNLISTATEGLIGGLSEGIANKLFVGIPNRVKMRKGKDLLPAVQKDIQRGFITENDYKRALEIKGLAESYNITLAPHQLYDKESMTNIWKYLRKHPQTSNAVKQFDDELSTSVENATEGVIRDISGPGDQGPFALGSDVQDAATGAITIAETQRGEAVKDLYKQAFKTPAHPESMRNVVASVDRIMRETSDTRVKGILGKVRNSLTTDPPPVDQEVIDGIVSQIPDYPMTFDNTKSSLLNLQKGQNLSATELDAIDKLSTGINRVISSRNSTQNLPGIYKTIDEAVTKSGVKIPDNVIARIKKGIDADVKKLSSMNKSSGMKDFDGKLVDPKKLQKEYDANLKRIANAQAKEAEPDYDLISKTLNDEKGFQVGDRQKSETAKSWRDRITKDYKRLIGDDVPVKGGGGTKQQGLSPEAQKIQTRNEEIKQILEQSTPGQDVSALVNTYNQTAFQTPGKIPDTDLKRLQQARFEIDDLIDGVSYDASQVSPSSKSYLNRRLNEIKKNLTTAMDEPSGGLYSEANQKFGELSDPIDRMRKSVVGEISRLKSDSQLSKIPRKFLSPAAMTDEKLLKEALTTISKESPELGNRITGGYVRDIYENLKATEGGNIANVAGKMHKHLFGTKKQRDLLETALDPVQYGNLEDLMTVFKRAAIGSGSESMTAGFQAIEKDLSKSAGGKLAQAGKAAFTPLQSAKEIIFDRWNDLIVMGNQEKLLTALKSDQATRLISKMKPLKPGTEKFLRTTGTLLNLLIVKAGGQKIDRIKYERKNQANR